FGEQGAHRGGIPLLDLALLQLLKSPSGLAYMIDGVAKFTQYAGIPPTRLDGFLPLQQAVDRHLQPERRAPESFAGSEKFDSHSQHLGLFRGTQGYHSRRGCFSRREISQLDNAANGRAASHIEQPAVLVDLFGFSKLDDTCA